MKSNYSIPLNITAQPYQMFLRLYGQAHVFFLDSSLVGSLESGFSYLGCNPKRIIRCHDFDTLRKQIRIPLVNQRIKGFWGGAVGIIDYEGAMCFGIYPAIIVFDHKKQQWSVRSDNMRDAQYLADWIYQQCIHIPKHRSYKKKVLFKSNFTPQAYQQAVIKVKKHIKDGDIYQINLSRRVELNIPDWKQYVDSAYIYGQLRLLTPTPFGAYFNEGKNEILSTSPERFLRKIGNMLEVKPMKGTRPRGNTKIEDRKWKIDLEKSIKEKAELLMVTDLERNDLGRVCDYGSVKVESMRNIEEYASVFQATSTIKGQLKKDCDVFDALKATFPSGSVTGCPKIEAMRIIKNIERIPRGFYTGAIGYISCSGDMDFSVLIRSVFLMDKKIIFHVGGGIVADSNPKAEYQETVIKAQAITQVLNKIFNR